MTEEEYNRHVTEITGIEGELEPDPDGTPYVESPFSISRFGFVLVSKTIILEKRPVYSMIRVKPNDLIPTSGWVFSDGEDQTPEHMDFYKAETLLDIHPFLEAYLNLPVGTCLKRNAAGGYDAEKLKSGFFETVKGFFSKWIFRKN